MKHKLLTTQQWVQALSDPACALEFDLYGFPMFFEARPGWHANRSSPRQHILYYCRDGSFKARADGRERIIRPGGLVWVQPGEEFDFQLPGRQSVRFARFRLRLVSRTGTPLRLEKPCLVLAKTGLARPWLDQIRLLANSRSRWAMLGRRAAITGFFAAALEGAATAATSSAKQPVVRALDAAQIARLEHFVETDSGATGSRTSSDLAACLGLAPEYFNRLFHATFQRSARAWLIEQRIRAAAQQLVESTRRISEVADAFGYTSLYFFSRQFRKVMGVSPRAYRAGRLIADS